jgi:hypothetical protein
VRPREVLALEEERGRGAQGHATAWHAAELIIDLRARRSRRLWLFGVIVLAVFEDLVRITPNESGIVTRMHVSLHQDVARASPAVALAQRRLARRRRW